MTNVAGRVVLDADPALTLAGSAELIAFGAAGSFAQGSLKASRATAHCGKALIVLRGREQRAATHLTVSAPGHDPASHTITLG